MLKRVLFCVFMFWISGVKSQSLAPEVNASAGDYFIGTSATLSWTLGESVIETYSGSAAILTQGFQQPITDKPISGRITYDNAARTKMTGVKVYLEDWSGVFLDSTTSTSNGYYWFNTLPVGSYITESRTTKAWGGVNATDALGIMKHFVNMQHLTGMKYLAADVDATGYVNTVDALTVAKRFVNMITYFSVGDWLFEKDTLFYFGEGLLNNFRAICFGDVDGSYTPPMKAAPAVDLSRDGIHEISSAGAFDIPLNAGNDIDIGAVSLVLSYPGDLIDILDIVPSFSPAEGGFVYTAGEGELRIAWYSLEPMHLLAGQPLLTMKARAKSNTFNDIVLSALPLSELADPDAFKINSANLTYPKFTFSTGRFSFSNYPNPFVNKTTLLVYLPEDALLTIKVYNAVGQELATLKDEPATAGSHMFEFDAEGYGEGAYLCKAIARGNSGDSEKTCLMLITR